MMQLKVQTIGVYDKLLQFNEESGLHHNKASY